MTKIALFQPDIAGNVGTIIRTCVCFDLELHIIKPCGFPFDERRIKKSAMDYFEKAKIITHQDFDNFYQNEIKEKKQRLILASTKGATNYAEFKFNKSDVIMFGRESSGVPQDVFNLSDARIFIPMKNNMRCLNVAISCGIISAKAIDK